MNHIEFEASVVGKMGSGEKNPLQTYCFLTGREPNVSGSFEIRSFGRAGELQRTIDASFVLGSNKEETGSLLVARYIVGPLRPFLGIGAIADLSLGSDWRNTVAQDMINHATSQKGPDLHNFQGAPSLRIGLGEPRLDLGVYPELMRLGAILLHAYAGNTSLYIKRVLKVDL